MRQLNRFAPYILVHVLGLLPLLLLAWDFTQGQLTANPIREIQRRTGKQALFLLVLSLSCTPTYTLLGLKQVLPLRRPLGLYAFMYASLHFSNFIGLDYGFDFGLIREDIFEKRYAFVGFAAFLILLALALTSTKGWRWRLGRHWNRLHWLVYGAAFLAVLHFMWQAKANIQAPLIYSLVVVLLLVIRIPKIKTVLRKRFNWLRKEQGNKAILDDI